MLRPKLNEAVREGNQFSGHTSTDRVLFGADTRIDRYPRRMFRPLNLDDDAGLTTVLEINSETPLNAAIDDDILSGRFYPIYYRWKTNEYLEDTDNETRVYFPRIPIWNLWAIKLIDPCATPCDDTGEFQEQTRCCKWFWAYYEFESRRWISDYEGMDVLTGIVHELVSGNTANCTGGKHCAAEAKIRVQRLDNDGAGGQPCLVDVNYENGDPVILRFYSFDPEPLRVGAFIQVKRTAWCNYVLDYIFCEGEDPCIM